MPVQVIDVRQGVDKRFGKKQDQYPSYPALMGKKDGTVTVPGMANYVWVRVGHEESVQMAYNTSVPPTANLPVIVGFKPENPRLLQVISVRIAGYSTSGYTPPSGIPYHAATHQFGGGDDVYLDWRRIMNFRVGRPDGFEVTIDPGVLLRSGAWKYIASQTLDLSASVPGSGTQARYVLVYLNSTGTAAATAGSIKATTGLLKVSDTPVPAAGQFALAAVRLYNGQTEIGDSPTTPDIVDLRFPQASTAGATALADLESYAQGCIIRGGASDWEAYYAADAGFLLAGDGTDVSSIPFDWDTFSAGTGADMVHSHASGAEGGKLAQANTHESADTDSATSALHHTLGTGANQSAAGNHTHAGGGGTVGGTGTAGRITQWAAGGADIEDSTLSKSGAGVLDIAAGGAYTLTVPQSMTSAGRDVANTFAAVQTLSVNDAVTNTITKLLDLIHNSSGTPAVGFGAGVRFGLEDSTTADQDAARILARWNVATHGAQEGELVLSVYDNGSEQVVMRLRPGIDTGAAAPNVIGGAEVNVVDAGVAGATIAGGGVVGYVNQAKDNYCTIGGGCGNVAGESAGTYDGATIGGGYSNVASGFASIIPGGIGNVASGQGALAEQDYCVASGYYGKASGSHASAFDYGQEARASGRFAADGDAQGSKFTLRRSVAHSDANWYSLYLDGSGYHMTMTNDSVWTFTALISGATQGCTKSFGFKIEGVAKNDGGTCSLLSSTVTTLYDGDDVSFDAQAVVDDVTYNSLEIQVKDADAGGDTVRWAAAVNTAEVVFPA